MFCKTPHEPRTPPSRDPHDAGRNPPDEGCPACRPQAQPQGSADDETTRVGVAPINRFEDSEVLANDQLFARFKKISCGSATGRGNGSEDEICPRLQAACG